jgi:outer membrane protein assembly factor BamB
VIVLLATTLLALSPGVATASDGTILTTSLRGSEEVPGPGDPDGFGAAALVLKPSTGKVCWAYAVRRVEPILAAHIHVGPARVAGPVVVGLGPTNAFGVSYGCTTADPALVAAIVANPSGYYVNVHNTPFPAGALRGQLGD